MNKSKKPAETPSSASVPKAASATLNYVLEKDWVVLRALALGDQFPDMDVVDRIALARQQKGLAAK